MYTFLGSLCYQLILLSLAVAVSNETARAQSLDQPGPLAVESKIYNLGDQIIEPERFPGRVELKGQVFYPRGLPGGPYPLIVLLHGRHPTCVTDAPQPAQRRALLVWPCPQGSRPIDSFLGYGYLSQFLASHGFVVISVSANGINAVDNRALDYGATARGELIEKHLDLWWGLSTKGGNPFGTMFVGKVDLNRIGTMGHSRGGEGILFHYLLNKRMNRPYTVRAVLPLAPMNQRRLTISGVPMGIILPYCDGDLSDLQGVHYFDDARYAQVGDPAPKYYFLMMGANHNFFNTVWSPSSALPGSVDDWSDDGPEHANDPFCGRGATSKRFNEQRQRRLGLTYMATFFRLHVAGDQRLAAYVQGVAKPLSDQKDDQVLVTYQAPDNRAVRYDLNRLQDARYLKRNSVGGNVQIELLETADMCGGDERQQGLCLPKESYERQPHNSPSDMLLAPESKGLSQLRLGWKSGVGRFMNELPPERGDISGYHWLQFRAALNFADARNQNVAGDFTIRIVDGDGRIASTRVGQYSRALGYPPGRSKNVPKVVLTTVRIPLDAFNSVNLRRTKAVEFVFDASPSGAILLSDIAFVRP
jgi:hypothetical protein